jgi:hypothetical protein
MNATKNHGLRLASQSAGLTAVVSAMEAVARGSAGSTGSKPSPTGSKQIGPFRRAKGKVLSSASRLHRTATTAADRRDGSARQRRRTQTRAKVFLKDVLWWWSVYPS